MDWCVVAPLYGSGVTWTLVYDTLYAHQDLDADFELGLQSTALTFGAAEETQKRILYGLASLTWIQWMIMACNEASNVDPLVFGTGATAALGHLMWQIKTAKFNDAHNLAARFRSNATLGGIIFVSLSAGTLVAN